MPCYDCRDDLERKEQKKRLDEATRAACEMASYFCNCKGASCICDHPESMSLLSESTQKWIRRHSQEDAQRRRNK